MGKYSFSDLFSPKSIKRRLFGPEDNVAHERSKPQRRWQLLQVEPALACNLHCVMCPWREISANSSDRGLMTPEIWDAIRPHLPEVQSIDFTGGGEPLLQPKLAEWIAEAKDAEHGTFRQTGSVLAGAPRELPVHEVVPADHTDTDALLREAGLSQEAIEAMRSEGVVA